MTFYEESLITPCQDTYRHLLASEKRAAEGESAKIAADHQVDSSAAEKVGGNTRLGNVFNTIDSEIRFYLAELGKTHLVLHSIQGS